jgi:hypothetical protein
LLNDISSTFYWAWKWFDQLRAWLKDCMYRWLRNNTYTVLQLQLISIFEELFLKKRPVVSYDNNNLLINAIHYCFSPIKCESINVFLPTIVWIFQEFTKMFNKDQSNSSCKSHGSKKFYFVYVPTRFFSFKVCCFKRIEKFYIFT